MALETQVEVIAVYPGDEIQLDLQLIFRPPDAFTADGKFGSAVSSQTINTIKARSRTSLLVVRNPCLFRHYVDHSVHFR